MSDIVERLRGHPGPNESVTVQFRSMVEQRHEAAAEIERLRAARTVWNNRDIAQVAEIERLTARAPLPTSAHWLGEREAAEQSRNAMDMRGCVLYFERQSDCLQFMRWLTALDGKDQHQSPAKSRNTSSE